MATFYPVEQGAVASPTRLIDGGAKKELTVIRRTWNLASQATTDLLGCKLPAGFRPSLLNLVPSVTLGTSTLAVGIVGTTGKYRAAATLTAPALAPVALAPSAKLTADEDVIFTIAVAALPASGTLTVEFWGTHD
jgi:hypothetical protein